MNDSVLSSDHRVTITETAASRIAFLMSEEAEGSMLRIEVKGGGCSGFKYDFSFDSKLETNDLKHKNIVIDKSSLDMLKGSQVDFAEELIGESFKISNPKTKASCGCGISFSF